MKQKLTSRINILLFAGIFCLVVFHIVKKVNVFALGNQEKIVGQLRAEIKREIFQEITPDIQRIVKRQVKEEFATYMASHKRPRSYQQHAKGTSPVNIKTPETLQDNVKKAVKEIFDAEARLLTPRRVQDSQLDMYVAGRGIESKLGVRQGIWKSPLRPEFVLAAADPSASKSSTNNDNMREGDWDITAEGEKSASIERTLQQKGSILLPKGTLVFEPSVTWAHFSSNRISINGLLLLDVFAIGEISTETVKRDIFFQNLAFKYGLFNNFQTEISIPFRGEFDRIVDTNLNETTSYTSGIGDINVGISRQIAWEGGRMPDIIAALSAKTNTGKNPYNREIGLGTGHWALKSSLIAAKASDPAVIFGSLSYTLNCKRNNIENFGDVDPGDAIGYSLGAAIALSYQAAINFSFDHTLTFKTERNDLEIAGSFLNVANFKTGLNWAFNEKASMDFSVSMGLTKDAPDLTVQVRFPYRF